jgi:DNA-binding response OmpR family regulator
VRVLVVEDEVRLAAGLRRGLQAEGFAVDVAASGTDGLWYARENPYDAIVLDVMLPGVDGYTVCSTLRAEGRWAPVLVLTARDGVGDEVRALDVGADDYLAKPFSYAVLVARLRALIRRGAPERPAVLEVGDLRLDPATREVQRGSTQVTLTPREFALLEHLMRRAGEVVAKRELLDHVWDFDFDGDPNIVEVYVGHLRRKVDRPFDRASLQTVRGAGYRLVADA